MRNYILVILLLAVSLSASAQDKKHKFNPKKFQADLEAYIVKEAELSQQESAKFLPVYREMLTKQHQLHKQQRAYRHLKDADEKAYRKAVEGNDEVDVKLKEIQKQYHAKFLNILPAKKVYKIIRLEERFHRQALSRKMNGK